MYLSIDLESEVKSNFLPERMAFWTDLVPELEKVSGCSRDSEASEEKKVPKDEL